MIRSASVRLAWSVALGGACLSCGSHTEDEAAAETPRIEGVTVVAARTGPFTERINAIGTVTPRPGAIALLSAPAATRVARVHVAVGQHVTRGAMLVELETAPFQARAQSAEAGLSAAERNRDRVERLVQQGILARREQDQAEAELARARAEAVAARREAELARMASPITGVVTRMSAVLGASVDANQPLVEVADPSALDILAGVAPAEAARIRSGAGVQLAPEPGGTSLGTGKVVDIGVAVDSVTRSVPVRVRADATQRPLRIGENLPIAITVANRGEAILIPQGALVPNGEGFKVFVVDDQSIAHEREVATGGRGEGMVEITRGLAAGERVVVHGAFGVEDGARVVPARPDSSKTSAP